jgi:hypothetical protein
MLKLMLMGLATASPVQRADDNMMIRQSDFAVALK